MNINMNRIFLVASIATGFFAPAIAIEKPGYLSEIENSVLEELNLARTNPKAYAAILKEYRATFSGKIAKRPGKIDLMTNEGTRAVDEAISVLNKQSPLAAMTPSKGMSRAAMDHVKDTGPKGVTGHAGTNGSKPFDRMNRYGAWQTTAGENISYGMESGRAVVIQLIVDDGVPSRGHRKNIYKSDFLRVGLACGPHKMYKIMCVQTLAGGYEEK